MHLLASQHTSLEIPGLDAATLARIAALIGKLTRATDNHRAEHLAGDTPGELHRRFHAAKQTQEKPYRARLLASTDPDVRHKMINSQMLRRAELIALSLVLHDQCRQDAETLSTLKDELAGLEPLASGLPDDHPLVLYCVGLASIISALREKFDLTKELSEAEDLSLDCALQAVNTIFEDEKAGLKTYNSGIALNFNLIRLSNPSPTQTELAARLRPLERAARELAVQEQNLHYSRISDWTQSKLVARLEGSMLPQQLRPDWLGTATFDEFKAWRDDTVASFLSSSMSLKFWKASFADMCARAKASLQAAYEELRPEAGEYVLQRQFDTEAGIDFYKAVMNCLFARRTLDKLAALHKPAQSEPTEPLDLSLDVRAYISGVIRQG